MVHYFSFFIPKSMEIQMFANEKKDEKSAIERCVKNYLMYKKTMMAKYHHNG